MPSRGEIFNLAKKNKRKERKKKGKVNTKRNKRGEGGIEDSIDDTKCFSKGY